MKLALFFMLTLASVASKAALITTGIVEVQVTKDLREDAMVKTTDGQVFWVSTADRSLVAALQSAVKSERQVEIDFNAEDNSLVGVAQVSAKAIAPRFNENKDDVDDLDEEPAYSPTVFRSYDDINAAHQSMDNRTFDDSQCYNRAHGWAYDLYRTRGVYSMKIFMFFTNKYIREFRHKWWFHVAPMSYVSEQYGVNEYVMDRSFSELPVYTRVWTNIFIKNQAECRSVQRYQDYSKTDPNEYCYLLRSTMYYVGTQSVKKRDQGGFFRGRTFKSKFNTAEIRAARKQAFIHYNEYDI